VTDSIPDRAGPQRSSDASLLRRVEVATHRIRELETDNKRLRHALAEVLGEQRAALAREQQRDTPRLRTSPPIGTARTPTSATPSATQNTSSQP